MTGRRAMCALAVGAALLAVSAVAAPPAGGQPAATARRDSPAAAGRQGGKSPGGRILRALNEAAEARQRAKTTDRYDDTFQKYSRRYFGPGWDWRLFKAQGMAESDLNPQARSYVGARGIMQLMPSTFNAISSKRTEFRSIDDPEFNIAAGIMHDRYLWGFWGKELGHDEAERRRFMFASYNAGEGTIRRAHNVARDAQLDHDRWQSIEQVAPNVQRWRYRETLGYVRKIESNWKQMSAGR